MPQYDFRLAAVLQSLENGLWLAEALFFPDISSCGDEPEFLLDTLQRRGVPGLVPS